MARLLIDIAIYFGIIASEAGIFLLLFFFLPTSLIFQITIFICINILFNFSLRFLAQYYIFLGQSTFSVRSIYSMQGRRLARSLITELRKINTDLSILIGITKSKDKEGHWNNYDNLLCHFKNALQMISIILKTFNAISSKGKTITKEQQKLFNQIHSFLDIITKSQLELFIGIKLTMAYGDGDIDIYDLIRRKQKKIETNDNLIELKQFYNIHFSQEISMVILVSQILIQTLKYYTKVTWIQYIFKTYLGSPEMTRIYFENRYQEPYYTLQENHLSINCISKIDYVIIKANRERFKDNENIRTLMIISGMNQSYLEIHSDYLHFDLYLDLGIDVLYWNYRGYGFSKGVVMFSNVKKDIIALYDHVSIMGQWDHYGTHGISIGGIPTTFLAANRKIDLLVSDRNFSSIDNIIKSYGWKPLTVLYKLLCMPNSETVTNYFNAQCKKIVLCSNEDTMISDTASLKSGVSLLIIRKYVKLIRKHKMDNNQSFSNSNDNDNETKENLLIDNNDKEEEEDSIVNTNDTIKDVIDLLLSIEEQKELIDIIVTLMNIVQIIKNDDRNKMKIPSQEDYNIPLEILNIIITAKSYNLIRNFFDSFSLYCITDIFGISINRTYEENRQLIGVLFSNLYVWDLNKTSLKNEDKFIDMHTFTLGSSMAALYELKNYWETVETPLKPKADQLYVLLGKISNQWKWLTIDSNRNSINKNNNNEDVLEQEKNLGKLIKLSCGHGDDLNTKALRLFEEALNNYSFGNFTHLKNPSEESMMLEEFFE